MTIALDTSIIIDIQKGDTTILTRLKELSKIHPAPPNIPFIVYFEFIYGLHLKSPKNSDNSLAFIEIFPFIEPTKNTAVILSDLKYKYEKIGKSFSFSDLLIAGQVIENNMTLVTRDRHFQEIEELKKVVL